MGALFKDETFVKFRALFISYRALIMNQVLNKQVYYLGIRPWLGKGP